MQYQLEKNGNGLYEAFILEDPSIRALGETEEETLSLLQQKVIEKLAPEVEKYAADYLKKGVKGLK